MTNLLTGIALGASIVLALDILYIDEYNRQAGYEECEQDFKTRADHQELEAKKFYEDINGK